jgi:hypothetical protein
MGYEGKSSDRRDTNGLPKPVSRRVPQVSLVQARQRPLVES